MVLLTQREEKNLHGGVKEWREGRVLSSWTETWQGYSFRVQVSAVAWLPDWCQGLGVLPSSTKFGQKRDYSGGRKAWMSPVCPLFGHTHTHTPSILSLSSSPLISLFLSFLPLYSPFVFLFNSQTKHWLRNFFWTVSPWGSDFPVCFLDSSMNRMDALLLKSYLKNTK